MYLLLSLPHIIICCDTFSSNTIINKIFFQRDPSQSHSVSLSKPPSHHPSLAHSSPPDNQKLSQVPIVLKKKMVALPGDFQVAENIDAGQASPASQTCNHKCTIITLSLLIPLLFLLVTGILVFALRRRRRDDDRSRKDSKENETENENEIAMRKLGIESESEVSSLNGIEGFGHHLHAVTDLDLEDGVKVEPEAESSSSSKSKSSGRFGSGKEEGSKALGWWKM